MAVRTLQLSIVFTIGFYLGPVAPSAVPQNVTDIPIPLSLHLTDPQDVVIAKGQPAKLWCDANSTEDGLRFSWYYKNELIPLDDIHRKQMENGTLYIPKVTDKRLNTSFEGRYHCLVSNKVGSVASNPAYLKIATIGRTFSEQPNDTQVYEKQPAVLRCQIHSTPAAEILWERNDIPLPHSTRYVPLDTGDLLITSTLSSDTGSYRCRARHTILNKTRSSKNAQLLVLPKDETPAPPQLLPRLSASDKVILLVGENLTLYCIVTGWPPPKVYWKNDKGDVLGNSSILKLHNVKANATGNYTCSARNIQGQIDKRYVVQVFQKPHFNVTPTSKLYPPAKTVRLDCHALGIPTPEIQWLKNGVPLQLGGRLKKQPSSLVLSHSYTTDSGIYQCVASNKVGRTWKAAQLIPTHSDGPSPPMNVKCRAFDDTSICLQWTPSTDMAIQAYSIYSVHTDLGPEYVSKKPYVLATGLNKTSNYTFYVRAYSKIASDPRSVWCKSGEIGSRNLKILLRSNTSVKLFWSEMSNDIPCGKNRERYKVQWRRANQPFSNVDIVDGFSHIVQGLQPLTEYEFRVTSMSNKTDNSTWTNFLMPVSEISNNGMDENLQNTTKSTLFPENMWKVEPLTPTSVNLTWFEPIENTSFVICYVEVPNEGQECENLQVVESSSKYIELKDLKPATCYELKISIRNSQGPSHTLEFCLNIDAPPPAVQNLEYNLINETTACLRWHYPIQASNEIESYVIRYTPDRDRPLEKWFSQSIQAYNSKACYFEDDETVSAILGNLKAGQKYTVIVQVRLVAKTALGNPTVPITVDTSLCDENEHLAEDNVYQKQKLGVILGLVLALTCIICCISGLLFRRRCLKRRAIARARLAASNNYYPTSLAATQEMSLPVPMEDPCVTEAHELEQLMAEEGTTHIPPVPPPHLDTKGGATFPNGQMNGAAKFLQNGHIANGHVHITENPQYYDHDCTELPPLERNHWAPSMHPLSYHSVQEDSNSNLENPKLHNLEQLYKYKLCEDNDIVRDPPGRLPWKPKHKIHLICNSNSVPVSEINNCSLSSNSDTSLNVTQLTCLEDSLTQNHRRISPALGPNG